MAYLDNYLKTRSDRLLLPHRAPSKRILKGERRRHVVDEVMDVLKDWRFSKFENEGSVRHGLRAAMCLGGNRWVLADIEADSVIQEALSKIGAKRPSWAEGQRDYTDPMHICAWCGQDLPAEVTSGARKGRFCSFVCAASSFEAKDKEDRYQRSCTSAAAYRIIQREKLPLRDCMQCGAAFRPFNYKRRSQRFCSHECSQLAKRRIPERECRGCGTTFRPRHANGIYCSTACSLNRPRPERECLSCGGSVPHGCRSSPYCSGACKYREEQGRRRIARQQRLSQKVCAYCEEAFTAKTPAATFCSPNCRASSHYHQKKRVSNIIYLTIEIFDNWFKRAA
ncbi:hypothetical protein [Rhizobium rhizogenes]|uniref:hypothetical protein n=1 Tax=Rhizobium rhizogenes TaxID=359 RepID=UPI001574B0DA|nr:hypothetical protein [Rhizobium rhizogenes]NTI41611.1 hypothetical protein [Rhizobium rhizogenes]